MSQYFSTIFMYSSEILGRGNSPLSQDCAPPPSKYVPASIVRVPVYNIIFPISRGSKHVPSYMYMYMYLPCLFIIWIL